MRRGQRERSGNWRAGCLESSPSVLSKQWILRTHIPRSQHKAERAKQSSVKNQMIWHFTFGSNLALHRAFIHQLRLLISAQSAKILMPLRRYIIGGGQSRYLRRDQFSYIISCSEKAAPEAYHPL